MEFLQQYDITIEYGPRKINPMDALSRRPYYATSNEGDDCSFKSHKDTQIKHAITTIQSTLEKRFQRAYKVDPQFAPNQIAQDWVHDDCF